MNIAPKHPFPSSFAQLHQSLQQNHITCVDVVDYFLERIQTYTYLNAWIQVYGAEAQQQARAIDQKIQAGQAQKLAGMVVGIKDLISYKDHPLQASSNLLKGFIAQFNATVTQRLLEADAILIGHQNCDEFGMGSSNETSAFGPVYHALDPTRVPGGSSGGSAVAVQTNMCQVALGSDTGGSVRQPAAFCGLVGLKPTYSRISRHGLIAYASSFDTIGILAHTVPDCAAVLETIAGQDNFDSTVSQQPVPAYTTHLSCNKKVRVAYLEDALTHTGLQAEIKEHTLCALDRLRKEGHQVESVACPILAYALPTYYILANAEASTNLARFDGVRYGYRSPQATSLETMYTQTRTVGFGKEVKRRILLGTFILSSYGYDSHYVKAQKVRRLIKEQLAAIFASYDFILLPTTPTTAFPLGAHAQDTIAMYLSDFYTVLASVAGIPAISIPNGVDKDQLPIGLQIMANDFEEPKLLAFAHYLMNVLH